MVSFIYVGGRSAQTRARRVRKFIGMRCCALVSLLMLQSACVGVCACNLSIN